MNEQTEAFLKTAKEERADREEKDEKRCAFLVAILAMIGLFTLLYWIAACIIP